MKSRPKESGRPRGQELEKLQVQLRQRLQGLASSQSPKGYINNQSLTQTTSVNRVPYTWELQEVEWET